MTEAKRTPLYEMHEKYGGRIVDFAGWLLPVQYAGIKEEHQAVRNRAGMFDVSHMGEVMVKGNDALKYVQNLVTNDVSVLADNQITYTPMCYTHGGTVDDLLVYKIADQEYMLVINAANIDKDFQWMLENRQGFDVELVNVSDGTAQIALQGPMAEQILSRLTDCPIASLKYYWFLPVVLVSGRKTAISRTGYTGEDGFEIYCRPEDAPYLWEAIVEAGSPSGLQPTGLGCRDTLRFEACMPLYGHELSVDISPLEAGLSPFVKLDKGSFNGREALAAQKADGLKRKIVGIEMLDRGVARAGYPVMAEGRNIGTVTSGTYCPTLNKNLGLALLEADYAAPGQKLEVEIRGKAAAAVVVPKPFYKRKG